MLLSLLGDALLAAGVPVHQVLLGQGGEQADASLGLFGFGRVPDFGVKSKDGAFWGVFLLSFLLLVVVLVLGRGGGGGGRGWGGDGRGQGYTAVWGCAMRGGRRRGGEWRVWVLVRGREEGREGEEGMSEGGGGGGQEDEDRLVLLLPFTLHAWCLCLCASCFVLLYAV